MQIFLLSVHLQFVFCTFIKKTHYRPIKNHRGSSNHHFLNLKDNEKVNKIKLV